MCSFLFVFIAKYREATGAADEGQRSFELAGPLGQLHGQELGLRGRLLVPRLARPRVAIRLHEKRDG